MNPQDNKDETKEAESKSSQASQKPGRSNFPASLPPSLESDRLGYSSRDGTLLSQLYSQPLVTTLSGFSQVAHLVRNPYELINNVDEFVKQASSGAGGSQNRKYQRTSENFAKTLNQNRHSSTPVSPIVQEMDTFVASSHDQSTGDSTTATQANNRDATENQIPIPALPQIESNSKRGRLEPLTIEEYEADFREKASDLELVNRVFYGSMSCNQLRAGLWPYLFGLVSHRGRFDKIRSEAGQEVYFFIEHESNKTKWTELQKLYHTYQNQWRSILPDQELRFSTFRERKSLIERDVIRCDRLHPFYAEEPQNLETLTNLLMTYMMYDFDIGYVQGMSDLAGPILFMYKGDLVKAFWVFVELNCLYELIKVTDPIFAQYLEEHDSSNCFFTFRAIVCQFKRELMRTDEDDYSKVLFLWDTTWSVKRRFELQEEQQKNNPEDLAATMETEQISQATTEKPAGDQDLPFYSPFNPNQSDSPRHTLTETEIFVQALCLSMIRRERDLIMANRLDGTDIHLHFIDPKLAADLNGFIEHAINIYSYMKSDLDLRKLTMPREQIAQPCSTPTTSGANLDANAESPQGSAEGYDLLSDFMVINGAGV